MDRSVSNLTENWDQSENEILTPITSKKFYNKEDKVINHCKNNKDFVDTRNLFNYIEKTDEFISKTDASKLNKKS